MEFVDGVVFAEADGDGEFGLGKVAPGGGDVPPENAVVGSEAYPGSDCVAVAATADEFDTDPMIAEGLVVFEEQGRTVDLSEDEIEIAVVVDIGEGGATSDDRLGDIGA